MSDIKNKVQGLEPSVTPKNVGLFVKDKGNVYESLVVISKRANQISSELKRELNLKLDEFASSSDSLEEIHENKEQIEISKFYERIPNSCVIATQEFFQDELVVRIREDKKKK